MSGDQPESDVPINGAASVLSGPSSNSAVGGQSLRLAPTTDLSVWGTDKAIPGRWRHFPASGTGPVLTTCPPSCEEARICSINSSQPGLLAIMFQDPKVREINRSLIQPPAAGPPPLDRRNFTCRRPGSGTIPPEACPTPNRGPHSQQWLFWLRYLPPGSSLLVDRWKPRSPVTVHVSLPLQGVEDGFMLDDRWQHIRHHLCRRRACLRRGADFTRPASRACYPVSVPPGASMDVQSVADYLYVGERQQE